MKNRLLLLILTSMIQSSAAEIYDDRILIYIENTTKKLEIDDNQLYIRIRGFH